MWSTAEPFEPHVPAWKGLGLKLKNTTTETPEPQNDRLTGVVPTRNQKRIKVGGREVGSDDSLARPIKKSINSHATNSISTTPVKTSALSASPPAVRKHATNRKSVSFTPETKAKDGESTKDLYDSWVASEKGVDPSFDPSSANKSIQDVALLSVRPNRKPALTNSEPSNREKRKKKKKRNKSKSTLIHQQVSPSTTTQPSKEDLKTVIPPPTTPHPALTYLTTYHASPETWKFSKARQSYILRHIFSLAHIPASYNSALKAYLSGLHSQTACQRLRSHALKTRDEDAEWLASLSSPSPSPPPSSSLEHPAHNNNSSSDDNGENPASAEKEEEEMEMGGETKTRSYHRQAFDRAVGHHKSLLRAHEEAKVETEKDRIWLAKVERRRRAEIVLWGVGLVDGWQSQSQSQSQSQRRAAGPATSSSKGGMQSSIAVMNGAKRARSPGAGETGKRKWRKRRKTGVPDDESTSSSESSSNSESEAEAEAEGAGKGKVNGASNGIGRKAAVKALDLAEETSSDSDSSETSSGSGSDSESGSSSGDDESSSEH
ncbi:MAG: hypothetical protein LQ351_007478 [Letrouitia transgressa]|nr:MAG: hypothetical protein LQ351_007478 [Letrouitia transgressa]